VLQSTSEPPTDDDNANTDKVRPPPDPLEQNVRTIFDSSFPAAALPLDLNN
jgi:hypothetical protein